MGRLLENDGALTSWQQFTVAAPIPNVTVSDLTAARGQGIFVQPRADR